MFCIFTLQQDIDRSGLFKRQQMSEFKNHHNTGNMPPQKKQK